MFENFRIKDLREDNFWSQEYVANILGITRSTYSNYELQINMTPINVLCDLAILYNVNIEYLCGLTNYRNPYGKFKEYDKFIFLENLRNLRKKHNYTQEQLGEMLSCSQNTISEYEKGIRNVPIDILIANSKLYNVHIDYITGIIRK